MIFKIVYHLFQNKGRTFTNIRFSWIMWMRLHINAVSILLLKIYNFLFPLFCPLWKYLCTLWVIFIFLIAIHYIITFYKRTTWFISNTCLSILYSTYQINVKFVLHILHFIIRIWLIDVDGFLKIVDTIFGF